MTGIEASTSPPPLPRWFGPRASPDDPAVSALIDRVARGAGWADIGGALNLNVRIDAEPPVVLRVHRPWVRPGRGAGLRRLRGRPQRAQGGGARPVPVSHCDLLRGAERWAALGGVQRSRPATGGRGLLRPPLRGARTRSHCAQSSLGPKSARTPRRPQNIRATALLGRLHTPQARTPQRAGRASDAPTDWRPLQAREGGRTAMRSDSWGLQTGQRGRTVRRLM